MIKGIINLFRTLVKPYLLKICFISYYFPFEIPSASGVGIHAINLANHLAEMGCEVHIFTFSETRDKTDVVKVGGGKIVVHSITAKFPFEIEDAVIAKRIKYSLFENKTLHEAIMENARKKFDIVHTHGWLTSSAFMLKYLYKIPWVHTVHALERMRLVTMTEEEKRLYRTTSWIEDTIADADKLIAVSDNSAHEIIKFFPKAAKKIEVIPNGIDLDIFKPSQFSASNLNVLCVTRFSKEKGIELLPAIAEKVLASVRGSKFKIIAASPKIESLKPITEKFRNLEKRYNGRFMWVHDTIMPDEIAKYYQESSVYLQPSFYETFGLCILEAMASGNAIVASDVGGIPEVIEGAGIVTKPDITKLSGAVIKILKDTKLRIKYSNRAKENAKKYDWKIISKRVFDSYFEVLKRKKFSQSDNTKLTE